MAVNLSTMSPSTECLLTDISSLFLKLKCLAWGGNRADRLVVKSPACVLVSFRFGQVLRIRPERSLSYHVDFDPQLSVSSRNYPGSELPRETHQDRSQQRRSDCRCGQSFSKHRHPRTNSQTAKPKVRVESLSASRVLPAISGSDESTRYVLIRESRRPPYSKTGFHPRFAFVSHQ